MIPHGALEDLILTVLCFNTENAPLLALKLTDENIFTNSTNKRIAQEALAYISKYSVPPGGQLEYLLETEMMRGTTGKLLRDQLDSISKKITEVQPEFVFDELDKFIRKQNLTKALETSLAYVNDGDLELAEQAIYKVATPRANGSAPILIQDYRQALSFLDTHEQTEFFSSGIELLDRFGVRPERKTMIVMIAAPGKGKSWWLTEVGKAGMQHHHKVLHVTLELSQEKTARRYIQSIFGLTKDEAKQITTSTFVRDKVTGKAIDLDFHNLQRGSVITQRKDIEEKLERMKSFPPVFIKEFPTSMLSTEQLSLYLDVLKKEKGFEPDLLIIDYADLMKIDAQSLRVDTGRLYRELRGMAVSRNLALATATQGNRESETARTVGSTNVSEDWSKIGTADGILTYSQTPEEYRLGLARIFVAKYRDDEGRYVVQITQAYSIGQFAIDSTLMSSDLIKEIEKLSTN